MSAVSTGPTIHYHVDTVSAQILYSANFWSKPGVIQEELFTQETINQMYRQSNQNKPFFIALTLQQEEKNTTIVFNQQTQQTLQPMKQAGASGIHTETSAYPVTIYPNTPARLVVEATYASR